MTLYPSIESVEWALIICPTSSAGPPKKRLYHHKVSNYGKGEDWYGEDGDRITEFFGVSNFGNLLSAVGNDQPTSLQWTQAVLEVLVGLKFIVEPEKLLKTEAEGQLREGYGC
jgi:hypothetical protein